MKILDLATQVKLDTHEASRQHVLSVAYALQRIKGNELVLVVGGNEAAELKRDGLTIFTNQFSSLNDNATFITKVWRSFVNNISAIVKLRKLTKTKPDIIYERHSIGSMAGIGLSKIMRRPLIFEVNGIPDEEILLDLNINNPLLKKILFYLCKAHLKAADTIIVMSVEQKIALEQKFNLQRAVVIPTAADTPPKKGVKKIETDKVSLFFVGKLDAMHDLTEVLSTIAQVKHDFIFNIVGEGKMRKVYEKQFSNDPRFIFYGGLEHHLAMELLSKSDVCLAAYNNSYPLFMKYGFYFSPLKIYEYLSYAKPCLYVGPLNESISGLIKEGAILYSANAEELGKHLTHLIESDKDRRAMKVAAKKASKKHTWDAVALETSTIAQSLIRTDS